ncbi:MAG: methylated-DNA--[protein]-cysteine S-methyltransferase [Spirochaetaceae bacterium]|nr:methylated-DNA--[protein]-cysteine S-methyltransferase [Spirochaetaceae bacterium]
MDSDFAIYNTVVGDLKIDYKNQLLLGIEKVEHTRERGTTTIFSDSVFKNLQEYFAGKRKEFSINYEIKGSEFQMKVWKELEKISYGTTKSYKEIAINIGCEKATRAVGGAIHRNPIGIIIPCHRVIGSNNKLVGYAGGVDMKIKLLKIEKILD